MIVTTGNAIDGYSVVEYLGVVRGIVVRMPTISQGIAGGFSKLFGGNIETFATVCETARADAYQRMLDHAVDLDADAVIGMRYDATEFGESITEVLAYGTAVKIVPLNRSASA